jgi:hypothetical protein
VGGFVFSYFMSGVKAYIPSPKPVPRLQKIPQIFDIPAWVGICLVLVFITVGFLYLAKPPRNIHWDDLRITKLSVSFLAIFVLLLVSFRHRGAAFH